MKILMIGKNGQLGSELHRMLSTQYPVIALGRDEVDLNDLNSFRETLSILPEVSLIVNAAAYTAVDRAETEERTATNVNTFAPEIMAVEAKRRGIPMIHFSTDYVFDGIDRKIPYTEKDRPNPLSVYGRSKFGGEVMVREILEKHLIFRTSGLYGGERNFVRTMLVLAAEGKRPRVVCDQTVSPNWCREPAKNVVSVIETVLSNDSISWGTYHLTGGGETTWFDFASHVYSHVRRGYDSNPVYPVPVGTDEIGAAAVRPAYSVLSPKKAEHALGIVLPHWETQFRDYWRENDFAM